MVCGASFCWSRAQKNPHVQREGLGFSHNATSDVTSYYSTRHRARRSFQVLPRLAIIAVANFPLLLVCGVPIALLQTYFELVLLSGDDVEIVVSKLAPLLLHLPFIRFQLPSTRVQFMAGHSIETILRQQARARGSKPSSRVASLLRNFDHGPVFSGHQLAPCGPRRRQPWLRKI